MTNHSTRRGVLKLASTGLLAGLALPVFGQSIEPDTALKPGQWLWYPERSESGPVVVIVSLSDQLAFVYRDGIRIGVSTVSSGRKGFETPTGVFTIFKKEKMHHSKAYNNAAMPDSEFFFGGAALHAGGLPGYPSSHGCVHLPTEFATLLFGATHNGTPVIITNERSGIGSLSHAGLILSDHDLAAVEQMAGHVSGKKLPTDRAGETGDSFSMLASGADQKLYGLKNGEIVIDSRIGIEQPSKPLGSHVFVLQGIGPNRKSFDWLAVGLGSGEERNIDQQRQIAVSRRLRIPSEAYQKISRNLHPGSTFMITDLSAHPDTRTGTEFVIMRDRKTS